MFGKSGDPCRAVAKDLVVEIIVAGVKGPSGRPPVPLPINMKHAGTARAIWEKSSENSFGSQAGFTRSSPAIVRAAATAALAAS
tara:strand:- start:198 stop:449 length:252 start_codon:yes stop_codon:yes gene_type:complete